MQTSVQLLKDSDQIGALAHPVRAELLESLRSPETAAGLARIIGRSRQFVSYHLKELERVGLIRHAGERRKGNFFEQLYQSVAKRFVVSAQFATNPSKLAAVFRDQVSLSQLAELGERLASDGAGLIDRAAYDGAEIPSATLEAEICFADQADRAAFMGEYVGLIKTLLVKYGGKEGEPFRIAMAAYPATEEST